jgi:hypothetical protein
MTLKDTLQQLRGDRSYYQIAQAYALAKDGEAPSRRDRYELTVRRAMEHPETAKWETLRLIFQAMGVDAETALAIAAASRSKAE